MEGHPKHDKKKNNKTMPVAINIGAGSLGMGGIVLFGGALVTATIVSAALAFRARQSSKKSRSASPETQTVDAPDQLEFAVKTDKDVSLSSKNQSSDEVTSMKELQSKSIEDLSREEKQSRDEKVEYGDDIIFSVVGEDEERYVDSVSKEKIVKGFEEDSLVEGGEEQKYCIETNQQTEADGTQNSTLSIEYVTRMEEYEEESMAEEEEMPLSATGHVGEKDQGAAAICVNNEVEEKECGDEMIELSRSYAAADGIFSEVVTGKEAIDEMIEVKAGELLLSGCTNTSEENQHKVMGQEACAYCPEMHTFPDGSDTVRETPAQLMTNKKETSKDEMVVEDEIQHVQMIDDHPDIVATQLMNRDEETEEAHTDDEPGKSNEDNEIPPAETQVCSNGNKVADESMQQHEEANMSMEEDETILQNDSDRDNYKPWFAKGTQAPTLLYHKAKLLPFSEISLVACLLLIFFSLAIGTALQIYLLM
ncbi:hypothetical protein L2E82_00017 [Cichorium intybus]|uniref:Uncharacterized protein n=1 Tax=Cichorium intybus TaxID=13427 RepID=A0ACB9GW58_CICIN|nr:hypothetical protein L2E82_00017 [Cichorium intybus]